MSGAAAAPRLSCVRVREGNCRRYGARRRVPPSAGSAGSPDITDAVAFLASDDARWITGTKTDVTGGVNL